MRYKIPFVWNVENDYLEALNIIRVDGEPTIESFVLSFSFSWETSIQKTVLTHKPNTQTMKENNRIEI